MENQLKAAGALLAACALLVVTSWLATPAAESSSLARPVRQATVNPSATPVPTRVPVGGKIQAPNACYVRLRDMPPVPYGGPGRYGMFAGFNPATGVLAAGGGAAAITSANTITFYQMYSIKLDSPAALWNLVGYSTLNGWTQGVRMGCREAASIQISDQLFAAVGGTGGCDGGRFNRGGDVKQISIGDTADTAGVNFVPGTGADSLVWDLSTRNGTLRRHFATYDSQRGRVIFGQGTFNSTRETETHPEVYMAHIEGSKFHLMVLHPTGLAPDRRYGSCGAYVYDKDLGLDGVLVLGGRQGGPSNTGKHFDVELWLLDFSKDDMNGEWVDLTPRIANIKDFGLRADGACAYDPGTRKFYTWMGTADAKIPQGAGNSSGAWRLDVTDVVDPAKPLTWERLAPDNTKGILGRTQIPNVWDAKNKRMFVIGGKASLNEFNDVWAIYPDVTGDACLSLDPYAPYAPTNPTATPVRPPTATPEPLPPLTPMACPQLTGLVPDPVVAAAIADPAKVQGWGELWNPNLPVGPNNPYRTNLGLQNPSAPYNPTYNNIMFKAGCP
jgi:hypothetical protein